MKNHIKHNKAQIKIDEAERFNPSFKDGLTEAQVASRFKEALVNKTTPSVTKSYWKIIYDNVFNFFNLVLIAIFILLLIAKSYNNLFFMVILLANTLIGLIQDVHARRLSDKLRVLTNPKVEVVREGKVQDVNVNSLVLDDIIIVKAGDQIPCDSLIMNGEIDMDESMITGESKSILRHVGDLIYSGTTVLGGKSYLKVMKIGKANYAATLQEKAKTFTPKKSEILRTLDYLFKGIAVFLLLIGGAMFITYGIRGHLSETEYSRTIENIAGSLIGMIPSGLYLLTSLTLAVGVIRLAKKHMSVQQLYSIEMLSRVDVLCLDKTGTITDGTMNVENIISLGEESLDSIKQNLITLVRATGDTNATANAILEAFNDYKSLDYHSAIPFLSETKYSAVMLSTGQTYVLGAKEFVIPNDKKTISKAQAYEEKGYRVLILATVKKGLVRGEKFTGGEASALIILSDHIKEDASDTIAWFKNNDVNIKIISGDNAITTSVIADKVGVAGADKYISLEGMSIEKTAKIASKFNVFGRVSPEQKEALIDSLKNDNHVVAMTGDGVNDILALKRADCSIAMASGSQAAKNVSHLVSLDSDFSKLPDVVKEGRRVINNLQRTASLFLAKTIFSIVLSIFFLICSFVSESIRFPFTPGNLYLWELVCIGLSSFFLALQPNNERIKSTFAKNIIVKSLPIGIIQIISVLIYFILYRTGVLSDELTYITMSVITFSILSFVYLIYVCLPFDIYRIVLIIASAIIFAGFFVFDYYSKSPFEDVSFFLQIKYNLISGDNWWILFVVILSLIIVYTLFLILLNYKNRRNRKNANC